MKSMTIFNLTTPVSIDNTQGEVNEALSISDSLFKAIQVNSHDNRLEATGFTFEVDADSGLPEAVRNVGNVQVFTWNKQVRRINKIRLADEIIELTKKYETELGRELNKDEKKNIKELATTNLAPSTFPEQPKQHKVIVTDEKILVEGNSKLAEVILAELRWLLGELPIQTAEFGHTTLINELTEIAGSGASKINRFTVGNKATFKNEEKQVYNVSGYVPALEEALEFLTHPDSFIDKVQLVWDDVITLTVKPLHDLDGAVEVSGIKFAKELTAEAENDHVAELLQVRELLNLVSDLDNLSK